METRLSNIGVYAFTYTSFMWFNDGKIMIPRPVGSNLPVVLKSQLWQLIEFAWGDFKNPDACDYK